MRRFVALAVLAAVVAGCGREHPGALAIRECLYAHRVTIVHLTYLTAAPPGVRDDWTGVEDITFDRRDTHPVGGVVLVARSNQDAARIRREIEDYGGPAFTRYGSNLLLAPHGSFPACL